MTIELIWLTLIALVTSAIVAMYLYHVIARRRAVQRELKRIETERQKATLATLVVKLTANTGDFPTLDEFIEQQEQQKR